jgi:hypothetical protein
MSRAPSFQFYPRDWRDFKVARLSLEAKGAYIDLLGFMFLDSSDACSLLLDIPLIAKALGVSPRKAAKLVAEMQLPGAELFIEEDRDGATYLVSKRLRDDHHRRIQQRLSSKAAATYRWDSSGSKRKKGTKRNAPAVRPDMRTACPSSSTSSSYEENAREDDATASDEARSMNYREWRDKHLCPTCKGENSTGCEKCHGMGIYVEGWEQDLEDQQ